MSMHLEKPYLTTTGKKKGKKKWASAEAKRAAEDLKKDWDRIMDKHKPVAPKRRLAPKSFIPVMGTSRLPEPENIPSLATPGGNAVLKESPVYTGTKVMGIATMHKSNSVPVFSSEEATEIATMRRS